MFAYLKKQGRKEGRKEKTNKRDALKIYRLPGVTSKAAKFLNFAASSKRKARTEEEKNAKEQTKEETKKRTAKELMAADEQVKVLDTPPLISCILLLTFPFFSLSLPFDG